MRRLLSGLLALALAASLTACGQPPLPEDGKTQVVCTLFPYYDFARQIGGDDVDVTLVVPAGRETHSFEPTPMDVIRISQADVFIYNGGESEQWVTDILDAAGEDIPGAIPAFVPDGATLIRPTGSSRKVLYPRPGKRSAAGR